MSEIYISGFGVNHTQTIYFKPGSEFWLALRVHLSTNSYCSYSLTLNQHRILSAVAMKAKPGTIGNIFQECNVK
jgi:hypothetical protein